MPIYVFSLPVSHRYGTEFCSANEGLMTFFRLLVLNVELLTSMHFTSVTIIATCHQNYNQ